MSKGADLLEALRGVQRLHGEVATLLRAADEYLVGKKEFRTTNTFRAASDASKSWADPHGWSPNFAARFYFVPMNPKIVAFASVCLVDRPSDWFANPFTEPLVSAGWVRFSTKVSRPFKAWGWGKMCHWTAHPRDGTPSNREIPQGEEGSGTAVEERCLTLPLVDITSTPDLVARLLDPMVATIPIPD